MVNHKSLEEIVAGLKRMLPAQAPLKDFIATNTLYAFQGLPFHEGLREAQRKLGIRAYLEAREYEGLITNGKIKTSVLEWLLSKKKAGDPSSLSVDELIRKISHPPQDSASDSGGPFRLRDLWKKKYGLNIITHVQPVFFRHLGHFLDQGISFFPAPNVDLGFWASQQTLERQSLISLFKTGKRGRAHQLLMKTSWEALSEALKILIGEESLYERYLFEMVLEHPGWSGLVAVIEENPEHLNFVRKVTLQEVLAFELLLELDYIESFFEKKEIAWLPLSESASCLDGESTKSVKALEEQDFLEILHSAWEWTYYQQLLTGIRANLNTEKSVPTETQMFFCIDDRCCSIRRHLEEVNPHIETFGTPGFFGVEFLYQSEHDRFPVKLCPAPLNPGFLIRGTHENQNRKKRRSDFVLSRLTHTLFGGWLVSQTFGLFSALRMLLNIFSPALSNRVALSFQHVDDDIQLNILRKGDETNKRGLKLGFSTSEMADRVYGMLRSCGVTENFADLVVMVGHGSSTVNNPHYAAYDCGACSGRPGSINARIFCMMANDREVRQLVYEKGIRIPESTRFVPGLYDTTRDQVTFYDLKLVDKAHREKLKKLGQNLEEALLRTSKERARRFDDIPLDVSAARARTALQRKAVSIFEPRQEFTHSGNAACVIGPRSLTRGLFLDRRSFLNSYDPKVDPEGDILCNILKAAVPVCGGINLQYYFSRIDNEKMGSGTKLPHNVVGLISVANGTEGDLRPGLPQQMVEWHEPLRLMILVYQEPDLALKAAKKLPATFEWIQNEWVKYACLSPSTGACYLFEKGEMHPFEFFGETPPKVTSSLELINSSRDYLPVTLIRERS